MLTWNEVFFLCIQEHKSYSFWNEVLFVISRWLGLHGRRHCGTGTYARATQFIPSRMRCFL